MNVLVKDRFSRASELAEKMFAPHPSYPDAMVEPDNGGAICPLAIAANWARVRELPLNMVYIAANCAVPDRGDLSLYYAYQRRASIPQIYAGAMAYAVARGIQSAEIVDYYRNQGMTITGNDGDIGVDQDRWNTFVNLDPNTVFTITDYVDAPGSSFVIQNFTVEQFAKYPAEFFNLIGCNYAMRENDDILTAFQAIDAEVDAGSVANEMASLEKALERHLDTSMLEDA